MFFTPRYITAQDVIDETRGKVPYNLVSFLPAPDTVTYDASGNTVLNWIEMPNQFLLLSPLETGTVVTQTYIDPANPNIILTAIGNYWGASIVGGYKITIANVGVTSFVPAVLGGTIVFTDDPNSINMSQLNTKIMRAEAQVEVNLNPLYDTPFVYSYEGIDYPYYQLPPIAQEQFQQAQDYLSNMIVTKAVIYILRMGFGKIKGGNGGNDYIENYEAQYKELKDPLFIRAKTGNLLTFPLSGLKINYDNLSLPYVRTPRVYNDNLGAVTFAKNRINNPGINVTFPWGIPRRFN